MLLSRRQILASGLVMTGTIPVLPMTRAAATPDSSASRLTADTRTLVVNGKPARVRLVWLSFARQQPYPSGYRAPLHCIARGQLALARNNPNVRRSASVQIEVKATMRSFARSRARRALAACRLCTSFFAYAIRRAAMTEGNCAVMSQSRPGRRSQGKIVRRSAAVQSQIWKFTASFSERHANRVVLERQAF
jgi:hypothetical protein